MNYLFIALGLVFGIFQLFLTKKCVDFLTDKNKKLYIILLIKLALYAGLISVMYILLRGYILWFGIGFGVGMIAGAFINFIITSNKDNKDSKGDDTP